MSAGLFGVHAQVSSRLPEKRQGRLPPVGPGKQKCLKRVRYIVNDFFLLRTIGMNKNNP